MKNKITKKVLIILLLIIQILQITGNMFSTVQASIKEGDTIELEGDHECDSLVEYWMEDYQKWSYKIVWYVYYTDEEEGVRYPAFCVEPAKQGVGTGYDSYETTISKEKDNKIWRVLNKGYMGSTYKEWNLECDDDFYSATKIALHSLVEGIAPKDKYVLGDRSVDGNSVEEIRRRGAKVLEVSQKLYEYGINGKEVYETPRVSISAQGEYKKETIGNTLYYVQNYKVTGNKNLKSYEVEIKDFPSGTKILDSKNKEKNILSENYFKVAIPINKIQKDIDGRINIKNAYVKTNPVFFCKSKIEDAQSYATYTSGYEKASTNTSLKIKSNKCNLEILKIDQETKEPIANVTFKIKNKNGDVLGKVTTNEKGIAKLEGLEPQNVIIKEIEVPANYVLSKKEKEVTLKWGEKTTVEFENELKKGNLRIIKVDKDNNEILLEGVKFEIYDKNGKLVKEVVTDEKGEVNINDLPIGDYTIKEKETKEGYKPTEEKEIEIKWKETTIIKIENEKQKGQIKIIKVSEDDNKINGDLKGTPLKDVVFELKREDGELVGTYVTDKEGIILTEELELGKYILKETKTNKNYILNEEEHIVQIEKDGEISEITITNKSKEPPKPTLPRTGF